MMKGWVGIVGWPVADGLPTLVVAHQLQVERRTGKVRQSETDVLPLCHATNHVRTRYQTQCRRRVSVHSRAASCQELSTLRSQSRTPCSKSSQWSSRFLRTQIPDGSSVKRINLSVLDWLSCGFTSHSTQNRSFRRRFPKPISWLGMKKTKPNTTKALIHLSKNVLEHKINRKKKQNPGSVAFYEIRPGNGAGLFSKEKKRGNK